LVFSFEGDVIELAAGAFLLGKLKVGRFSVGADDCEDNILVCTVEGEDAELVVGKLLLGSFESVPFPFSCGNGLAALVVTSFSATVLAGVFEVRVVTDKAVLRVASGFGTTAEDDVS
jgi:hypothetical protein